MTKQELKKIFQQDIARYGGRRPSLKDWFVHNESWYLYHIVEYVRYMEYHKGKGGWHRLAFLYYWYKYKGFSLKLHITLYPGTIDGGLRIYHPADSFMSVLTVESEKLYASPRSSVRKQA